MSRARLLAIDPTSESRRAAKGSKYAGNLSMGSTICLFF
jgi:hypothetical protein